MTEKRDFGCITGPLEQFYVEWKIKEYLAIQRIPEVQLTSPEFSLCNSKWHLRLKLEGSIAICDLVTNPNNVQMYVALTLRKLQPQTPYRISCTLGIKTNDGNFYKSTNFIETFKDSYLGPTALLKQSEFYSNKSILGADDTATFFCSILLPKYKRIDSASQTLNDNDHITLSQDFKNLFLNETCSDVTIKVHDQEIRAHSQVLAARCSVFESMFTHEMKEKKTGVVDVEDCEPAAFREFLSFLYSGEIEKLSSDNVIDVYAIANKYNMAGLKDMCLDFMKETLCIDSFCDVFSVAIKYEESELVGIAIEFFLKEGKHILKTVEWLKLVKEFPLQTNELVIKIVENISH